MMAAAPIDEVIGSLRESTRAERTTLRLENAREGDFAIVAESVAPGVPALRGGSVGDLRAAATFQYLERERRVLVQDDLATADPAPPPDLVAAYGVRAQMLAPVLDGERLIGIVSVHATRPRAWSADEVAALEDAAARITATLQAGETR